MRAFTLLELIFVIVIMGVMTAIGTSAFTPKYLVNDVNFIQSKIKEAQFRGIGYEHNSFASEQSTPDYENGCIDIEKSVLHETPKDKESLAYTLHIDSFDYGDICFDFKGRPHRGDFTKNSLIKEKFTLIFTYNTKQRTIIIEPITGYVIIRD